MNRIMYLVTTAGLSAALAAFPVTLTAASSTRECVNGKPTAASYTWDFHKEADRLFTEIQSDSQQVVNHAAKLQSFSDDYELDWQPNADQLNRLKSEVNDVGQKLCRLETIRRVVAPWQQNAIDQIAPSVQLMADNVQDAIMFGNAHRNDLWNPTFRRYADNIYTEATTLQQSVGDAVQYANVLRQYGELRAQLRVGKHTS